MIHLHTYRHRTWQYSALNILITMGHGDTGTRGKKAEIRGHRARSEEVLRAWEGDLIPAGCTVKMLQELRKEIVLGDDHPDVTIRTCRVARPRTERDVIHGKKAEGDHAPTSHAQIYNGCHREAGAIVTAGRPCPLTPCPVMQTGRLEERYIGRGDEGVVTGRRKP